MPEPLSQWLSEQTADLHRQVEADVLPGGRVASFTDVVRLVSAHAGVLRRYAEPIDVAQPLPATAPLARWRMAADADLAAWGVAGERSRGGWPEPDVGELVGVRYVLEGARLGLRILAPGVATTVRTAGAPASVFFVPEPDAGQRWRAVRAWLDGAENHTADREQVLRGARAGFQAYRDTANRP